MNSVPLVGPEMVLIYIDAARLGTRSARRTAAVVASPGRIDVIHTVGNDLVKNSLHGKIRTVGGRDGS